MGGRPSPSPPAPSLAQWAPAIRWLRDHAVGIPVLGDAFGMSRTHVAVLDWRGRRATAWRRPWKGLGIGLNADGVQPNVRRIEGLTESLEGIRSTHARTSDFTGGLQRLVAFRPQLGRPHSMAMLRLLAQWYEHHAWFATHGGLTQTAVDSADAARRLWTYIYGDSRNPRDLRGFVEATLVASHAHLYVNEPAQSLALLTDVRDASEVAARPLGSEYMRQLGTAYALESQRDGGVPDPVAARVLAHAAAVMGRLGEAESDTQLAFAHRQAYLVTEDIDVDGMDHILETVQRTYGQGSFESAIAVNYDAAAALTTDVNGARFANAMTLLAQHRIPVARFPRQTAAGYLLSLTPRLRLSTALRRAWVRQVYYLNPYRR